MLLRISFFCFLLLLTTFSHAQSLSWKISLALRNRPASMMLEARKQLPATPGWGPAWAKLRLIEAQAWWQLGRHDSAHTVYLDLLESSQQRHDSSLQALAWQGLATVAWRYAYFDQALDYQLRAWRIVENMRDSALLPKTLYWLGVIHADLRMYRDAISYYRQSLELASQQQDSLLLGMVWNNIGRAYRKQEIYDSARVAHRMSLPFFVAIRDSLGLSDYWNNIGSIHRREGRLDSAIAYFLTALEIQTRIDNLESLADGYNDLGTTYSQMGNFPLAFQYLQRGLRVARQTRLRDDVRYAYASLAATCDSVGDFRNALQYYRLEAVLRDSLLQEATQRRTDLLTMIAQGEQQRSEILRLQLQDQEKEIRGRKQRLWFLGILGVIGLALAFFLWQNRLEKKQAKELAHKNRQIHREKLRYEELLHNVLPKSIADEMVEHGKAMPRLLDPVTVMFVDFVGFSQYATGRHPRAVVADLQTCFEAFDRIVEEHGLEKIKTIGDAYMCAGGAPEPDPKHPVQVVRAALKMQQFMAGWIESQKKVGEPFFQARVGIHSGPVVAGVVGLRKFTYDMWGETVNIAARMESASEPGEVNISGATYKLVYPQFISRPRGKIQAKSIGEVEMYFVDWGL